MLKKGNILGQIEILYVFYLLFCVFQLTCGRFEREPKTLTTKSNK